MKMLVDHAEPMRQTIPRTSEPDRAAGHEDGSLVRLVETGEDGPEGALARTVLTQQRVDLPALEGEVDVGVGDHAGERFAEVMPLEGGVAALEDTGAVRCAHFVGICPRTPSTK